MTDDHSPTGTGQTGGVVFDPDACRAWLHDGAADEHSITDDVTTTELTIAAALERLLQALHDDPQPHVWRTTGALHHVQVLRTADGDGIDGGAIITADLSVHGHDLRLATLHQPFDAFTDDDTTCGIDAAVEALGHVAAQVNATLADLHHILDPQPTEPAVYTVLGIWDGDEPVAVGVVTGEPQVTGGDSSWQLWAQPVTAPTPEAAEQAALTVMRATLAHSEDEAPDLPA